MTNKKTKISSLKQFDNEFYQNGKESILGIDEVGRGCLAGPVVIAGVIVKKDFYDQRINDSKKLTKKLIIELSELIKDHSIAFEIVFIEPGVIDQLNILKATILGVEQVIASLKSKSTTILVDYLYKGYENNDITMIKKGDATSFSIACASILAKNARDQYMKKMSTIYPFYGFETNVGYPTKKHYQMIEKYGITPLHRRSFRLTSKSYQ
ncbi:ribonuclease HII [Ureaplasma canigenitalium]|uniref:ribonuclease HII n=1 Tax=Ureaplasma canigenitalium TaxID=42092 RepID=UPI00068D5409|nr:ribonuclease HII [Ureaplasma canigenitalium]